MATMANQTDLTAAQQKVLDVLHGAGKALSAYDILEKLQQSGIKSPPTIYRALEKLATLHLIHRIESLNAYVACNAHVESCGHDGHHHDQHVSQFAICTACQTVREISSDELNRSASKAGAAFLASIDKKVFELSGLCHACAAKAA